MRLYRGAAAVGGGGVGATVDDTGANLHAGGEAVADQDYQPVMWVGLRIIVEE